MFASTDKTKFPPFEGQDKLKVISGLIISIHILIDQNVSSGLQIIHSNN